MIPYSSNPIPVRVGYWFIQRAVYDYKVPAGEPARIIQPHIKEVRFDKPEVCYEGLLHGFGVEGEIGEGGELCVVALVEKPDGTFVTPAANTIQLIK